MPVITVVPADTHTHTHTHTQRHTCADGVAVTVVPAAEDGETGGD